MRVASAKDDGIGDPRSDHTMTNDSVTRFSPARFDEVEAGAEKRYQSVFPGWTAVNADLRALQMATCSLILIKKIIVDIEASDCVF